MYEERVYRNLFKSINLKFFDVCVYETDLRIGANTDLYDQAFEAVKKYRLQIENYIEKYPEFLKSLKPVEAQKGAPYIVEKMCEAAAMAGVGPMAAVAGAISEMVGFELLKYVDEIIVENGGDIFIKTGTARKVGIYAGNSPLNERIALEVHPQCVPIGICTSSGTVGHSLSFGKADAVVILSDNTFLADATATAACNIVKSAADIEKSINFASDIQGIQGAVVIVGDKVGAWGDISLVKF